MLFLTIKCSFFASCKFPDLFLPYRLVDQNLRIKNTMITYYFLMKNNTDEINGSGGFSHLPALLDGQIRH